MNEKITQLINKGFFHIFGSNVLNQIIGFASSIFLVRLLTKSDYGLFSYAQNILSFFLLFNGLGATAGILQFASETDINEKKYSIIKYGTQFGLLFNVLVAIIMLLYSKLISFEIQGSSEILSSMFLLPLLFFVFQVIQVQFRVFLENKKFSFVTSFNTFIVFVLSIIGALLFSVKGIVLFRYIAYSITIITGILIIRQDSIKIFKSEQLQRNIKKQILKFSAISSFNNAISQMLYIIDIFLIGIIIADESIIASYKTATLIPFALKFIPSTIMVFVYPYFAKNNTDKVWVREKYLMLTKGLAIFNLTISVILFLFAPFIIRLIFGIEYLDAVVPFRILSVGYFVAGTFRIPAGNVLVMMRQVKFGLYLAVATGIFNIVLDVILIKNFGSNGAAVATVSVYIFTSIIGVWYLLRKLKVQK